MTAIDEEPTRRVEHRTCPLCEATCGLAVTFEGDRAVHIRGDRDDVFSKGFICPKGSTLRQLDEDPDRLRTPMIKGDDGVHRPATWDEAFAEVARRLPAVVDANGRDAVAIYVGNPNAHNLSPMLYNAALIRALGTSNRYSASTVDQMPKQVAGGLMFGTGISVPVPDVDRTDHLLVLGANPFASNGSLMTAPDIPGRLRALRARGGRLVVVDPRRSKTAEEADEHVAIRPGTDAFLLFALVHVLVDDGLVDLGSVGDHVAGLDEVARLAADFTPEVVAPVCGIDAPTIRRMAAELAAAPTAAVYGRIGTCTQEFGTIASWLVDVVNTLTGNLDRPGGAMFTRPATGSPTTSGAPGRGRGIRLGSRHTRVRGLAGALGELPVVALAEEITTPGEGQVRALFTVAGNPVLSTPDSAALDAALGQLELMVSVDIYLNETTRHAHVILPGAGPFTKGHYDLLLYRLAIRNVANWSPPSVPLAEGELDEWEILARLALIAAGEGPDADPATLDDAMAADMVARAVADPHGPVHGRDAEELVAALGSRRGPARLLDLMLRTGPYGEAFGANPGGLSLDVLEANPHGVDLGPLEPRVPEALRTPSGMIELAPPELVADTDRLRAALDRRADDGTFVLIGRRDLRSNNSWMHNLEVLVKGRPRCTMHVHPDDAERLGLVDGATACVTSRVNAVEVPVEVTDSIMPGVVSIPHGWGHGVAGTDMAVAGRHAGVNANLLVDAGVVDPLSGNAVLNGVPVTVAPVTAPAPVPA
ncbi:MAG TPA: molybdopterin-dependent oxidoreductase [Acidimicrobiales bacterium]|nr:molybdopterin-dependent oxidoreductase [Acidimicrobiales bacterium]